MQVEKDVQQCYKTKPDSVTDVCVWGGGRAVSSYKLHLQLSSKEKQYVQYIELVLATKSSLSLSLSEVRQTHMCLPFNHPWTSTHSHTHTHARMHACTHKHTTSKSTPRCNNIHTHMHAHTNTQLSQSAPRCNNIPIRCKVPSSDPQCAVGQVLHTP